MFNDKHRICHKSSVLLTTVLMTACLATVAYAVEPVSAFSDVTQGSPYYAAIQAAYEKGIVAGTGNGTFQPNDAATLPQICTIYMHHAGIDENGSATVGNWAEQTMAQAVSNGLLSAYEAKNTSCSWIFLLEKILEWEDLPVYSQTLWGDETKYPGLNIPETNTICSAEEYGLLDGIQVQNFKCSPSRGEVVQLFYNLENSNSKDSVPGIVAYFPIYFNGVEIMCVNDSYNALMDVPQFYLDKFKKEGWTFNITAKNIWQIPGFEELENTVGVTSYGTKEIYVSATSIESIQHEFGHFAQKVAVGKEYPGEIWKIEKMGISELTKKYSETSEIEAFACTFTYFCQNWDNKDKISEFKEKCPLTYEFMMANYFTPEILSFTGEDFCYE